jgi:hypothetical protein
MYNREFNMSDKVDIPKEVREGIRTPTAQELKKHFLDIAWPIVDSYVNAALGHEDLKSTNSNCREEVWELVKKLMVQSSDKMNLAISEPLDIIKAVECGECTFKEAEQLLDMYKRVKEIENIENGGNLGGMPAGLQINILGAETTQDLLPNKETKVLIDG